MRRETSGGSHSEEEDDGEVGIASDRLMDAPDNSMPSTLPSLSPEASDNEMNCSVDLCDLPLISIEDNDGIRFRPNIPCTNANHIVNNPDLSTASDVFEGFQKSITDADTSKNKISRLSQISKQSKSNINITTAPSTPSNSLNPPDSVIFIQQTGHSSPNDNFFANNIKLSKALQASLFGRFGISKINKIFHRKLLVVVLNPGNEGKLDDLLSITKLGNWNIQCWLPLSKTI